MVLISRPPLHPEPPHIRYSLGSAWGRLVALFSFRPSADLLLVRRARILPHELGVGVALLDVDGSAVLCEECEGRIDH